MTGVRRESKVQFWQRIQREGGLAQAQTAEADLLHQRLSRRHVQHLLVARFQPADGTRTRAWPTPDSWKWGRRFARKPVSAAEQYEGDLNWAYNNLGRIKPEEAPDARKRSLLLLAEQKPADFHRKYQRALPGITRRQEAQEEERKDRWEQMEWERLRPQRKEQERRQREAKRKRVWRQKKRQQREAEQRAEQERQRLRAEQERKERERQERREATLAVLRERRTTEGDESYEMALDQVAMINVQVGYRPLVPAWPQNGDREVIESSEVRGWLIKLEKANEKRRLAAEKQAQKALPARVAEYAERFRQEREALERTVLEREGKRLTWLADKNARLMSALNPSEKVKHAELHRREENCRRALS